MCALLNQFALLKHVNAVGIHGIGQAVRNHHNRFLLFKLLNELQNISSLSTSMLLVASSK